MKTQNIKKTFKIGLAELLALIDDERYTCNSNPISGASAEIEIDGALVDGEDTGDPMMDVATVTVDVSEIILNATTKHSKWKFSDGKK